jgi:transposase
MPLNRKKKSLINRSGLGGGCRVKISAEAWQAFRSHLAGLEQQHFTSRELQAIFQSLGNAYVYSPHYFTRLLRTKLQLHYYKPEPRDYRQAADAEEKLKTRIQATLDAFQVRGLDIQKMAIGFADECAAQFHANNARFWSLAAHLPRPINSELGSQKFFGFYAFQGQSTLNPMDKAQAEDFKVPLLAIKAQNPDKSGIVIFWDNAPAHRKIEAWAWQQNIFIIPLPAYSPDLNPIERVWKACKRWLNEQPFCQKLPELAQVFEQAYNSYKVQLSFAKGWLEKMSSIFSWISPMVQNETAPT